MADALPYAGLTTASAWSPILDAYGKAAAYRDAPTNAAVAGDKAPDLETLQAQTIDRLGDNQLGVALRQRAKSYAPDPVSVGTAGQIAHGLVSTFAKAAAYTAVSGPAAPVLATPSYVATGPAPTADGLLLQSAAVGLEDKPFPWLLVVAVCAAGAGTYYYTKKGKRGR